MNTSAATSPKLPSPSSPAAAPLGLPPVFAHRGGWGDAPQNTVENLRAAAAAGADLEYDVHRTLDGALVVHHDAEVGGAAIASLRRDQLPPAEGTYAIPTFAEALAVGTSTGRKQLVETKALGYEAQLLAEADAAGVKPGDLFVQSFIPDSVRAVKQLRPDVPAGLLVEPTKEDATGLASIPIAREVGADFIMPKASMATEAFLDAAEAAQLPVVTWAPWKEADGESVGALLANPRIASVIANQREAAVAAAKALGRS